MSDPQKKKHTFCGLVREPAAEDPAKHATTAKERRNGGSEREKTKMQKQNQPYNGIGLPPDAHLFTRGALLPIAGTPKKVGF